MRLQGIIIKKELLILIGIVIWAIYFIIKCKKIKWNIDKKFVLDNVLKLILIVYVLLVVGVTLLPIRIPALKSKYIKSVINLNVLSLFDYGFNKYAIINLIGNIALLAPLPILLHLNNINKLAKVKNIILFSFLISISIETLQAVESYFKIVNIPRASDILDLIFNIIGGLLGYCVLKIYQKNTNLQKC